MARYGRQVFDQGDIRVTGAYPASVSVGTQAENLPGCGVGAVRSLLIHRLLTLREKLLFLCFVTFL